MSCITEILKKKGDAEFLPVTQGDRAMGLVIEGGGLYKDYEYIVTFNDMGFRCGYVAVAPTHPLYDKDCTSAFDDEDPACLHAHGGITFHDVHDISEEILGYACQDKWIGFDAGHCFDIVDLKSVEKYFPDLRDSRKDHVVEMAKLFECRHGKEEIRNFDYMEDQCKYLIDQLINKEAA